MNIFRKLFTSLLFLIFVPATLAVAQEIFEPSATLPAVQATRTDAPIAIDGTLNEPAWNFADTITGFVQIEPQQGMPARNRTVVKVLYDDTYLYVGVFCFDSLGRQAMRAPDMKRDFEWRSHDTFAVCIDGFHDKRNSVTFATNPLGAQKDYLSFDDALFDSDWNGLWAVRTTVTDAGWFAEFRIPFKTIRYPRLAGDDLRTWGINFLRLRRASNEISVWAPYPRAFGFNRMPYAGELQRIQPPPPSPNIQLNPYALVAASRQQRAGGGTTETYDYKAGGEIKWAINSNTIADLTVNTDFAQADADVQVNNVTRFSVLFPEKRQFFLENASLLGPGLMAGATGGNMQLLPFFSRRIGLSDAGDPLPLHAGVRLASRSVKQNFGVMAARQGSGRGLPAADFAVARYARNVGKQNRFGVIGTLKSAGGHTNVVGGADGFVRFNASQSLNIMALHAHNSQGGSGFGGYAQYYYTSNAVTAWLTETVLTKNFNPETGFVSRTNVIATTPGAIANLRGKYLPLKKYIRSFQPSAFTSWYHQASTGTLVEREIRVAPFRLDMQDGGYYEVAVSDTYQNLLAEFTPLGVAIAAGHYRYRRCAVLAGSDPSRKISYTAQYDVGDYYNGRLQTADVSVSLVPIPHVSLKGSVNANRLRHVGELRQSANVVLYTVQARLAVNPRLQLTGLYQHRSTQGLDSYNIRLAWEYKPLSYVYVVLNSRELPAAESALQREQQGIVKVSYLRQF